MANETFIYHCAKVFSRDYCGALEIEELHQPNYDNILPLDMLILQIWIIVTTTMMMMIIMIY